MSSVIQFLETMGRSSGAARWSAGEYGAAVGALDVREEARDALLGRDRMALNSLLDGRAAMYCYVATPDEREPDSVPDNDDDNDGVPDRDEPDFER